MKFLRMLAAVAPLFAAGAWAAESSSHNLVTPESLFPQLDAILKQAVAQSPAMVARAVDEQIAENDRITAHAGLLPSVGGYYNYYEARDKRGDLPDRYRVQKTYYYFSVTQPLFYWGERKNNDRIGEIRLQIARGNLREGYRLLAQEVRAGYLRLVTDKLRAKRATLGNNAAQNGLKRSEDRLAKHEISEAQIFAIRLDAERTQIAYERAQFDYENSKAAFARLTGMPVLKDDEIPDSVPAITPQSEAVQALLAGYLGQAENPTAEAANMRRGMEIEKLNLANNKTRLRPKFNFVLGTNQDEQSYTINAGLKYSVQSYFAGISTNWQIFDGFATRSAVRNSLLRVRQLERDYRNLTERLAQTAQNQVKALGWDLRTASINDRLFESTTGYLRTRRDDFKRGAISEEDVNATEMSMVDTQIAAYGARIDYYLHLCEFLGTIVEDPVITNVADR